MAVEDPFIDAPLRRLAAITATRRRAAAVAGGLAVAALGLRAAWIEPRRMVVRHRELRLPRWSSALDGLRVAVVADLHAGAPHVDERKVERIVERVNRERPDLVALLGDYVDHEVPLGKPVEPEAVAARLGALRAPLGAFAVLGNHDLKLDGERVRRSLEAAGIRVLDDEPAAVEHAGERLWLVGLGDATRGEPDVGRAFERVPPSETVLALTHNPDLFPAIPERAALTLAGHTHGAQVDLPLIRRKVIPSRFGDRFARGHIEEGRRQLFVSRGIGTSLLPLRLRATPEVTVLRLARGG